MTKLINDPTDYVDEMLDGLCRVNPDLVLAEGRGRTVVRRGGARAGRVGVVSGGGSGHLPLFTGYVGEGLLEACAVGNVFEGPAVDACKAAIAGADGGAGVLCLFGNYGGDRMNFEMACEMLEIEGIETRTVIGTDDIASAGPEEAEKRRGVAGLILAFKAAGAAAAGGVALDDVARIAQHAVDRTRTLGVALSGCTIPGANASNFTLPAGEMELGMGIHGEPGLWREEVPTADALVDELAGLLLAEMPQGATRVMPLVNSLGATPQEELFILYRRLASRLAESGLDIVRPLVGPYVTSMEMAGVSISLCFLDNELEELIARSAQCPFWTVS